MPRNYYQLQQMKTQNMKREYLGNITQKKGKFESSFKQLKKSVSKYATIILVFKKKKKETKTITIKIKY